MFAFFGLGISEIIVLAVVGLILILVPALILVAVMAGSRKSPVDSSSNEVMELRAEIKRLREEVARLKEGKKGSSDGIQA